MSQLSSAGLNFQEQYTTGCYFLSSASCNVYAPVAKSDILAQICVFHSGLCIHSTSSLATSAFSHSKASCCGFLHLKSFSFLVNLYKSNIVSKYLLIYYQQQLTMPINDCTLTLLVSTSHSYIHLTFSRSITIPSLDTTCPRNLALVWCHQHFNSLSISFYSISLIRTF